jgi:flagellar hook-associated protein 1
VASGSMISIGTSALLAYQRALATTGHNISNVSTQGYTRQRSELVTSPAQYAGNGYVGTGVSVKTTERIYNQFLVRQENISSTNLGQIHQFYQLTSQLDNILSNADTGLSSSMQGFFNSIHDVANDPAALSARNAMLGAANQLTGQFQMLNGQLNEMQTLINGQVSQYVVEINQTADSIAKLNTEISLAQKNNQSANDLLDSRDQAINQLASLISVQSVELDDGTVNVFVGSGQSLVTGSRSSKLTVLQNQYNPATVEVGYQTGGASVNISGQITGGALGGLLDFRTRVLDPTKNSIGHIALGLITEINNQNQKGMDLNGNIGVSLFKQPVISASTNTMNGGTAGINAGITDIAAMTTSDYLVRYDGAGSWTLTRLDDNYSQTGPMPLTVDGLSLTIAGVAVAGDRFLLQPTQDIASQIGLSGRDPRSIAAAAPVVSAANLDNAGNGSISMGEVTDVSDPGLLTTVNLVFVDAANYQINGSGPSIAYVSGANIDINGWRVQINGTPTAGDAFAIGPNQAGIGDNRNALKLAGLQSENILFNNTNSFNDANSSILSTVGNISRSTEINKQALTAVHDQAVAMKSSVSGVNLDEEAANLIHYEQAYQAAAKIITVANEMFDTLLLAIGR